MDQINQINQIKKKSSLRYSFFAYCVCCMILAGAGMLFIGYGTNDLQEWYRTKHADLDLYTDPVYIFRMRFPGEVSVERNFGHGEGVNAENARFFVVFWIISNAQVILIPIWMLGCVTVVGVAFYRRELKEPIRILLDASRRIEANELDFKVEYAKPNELGELCAAFDKMRSALWENNRRMWRSLEERKRLNVAFSHDLRTPLTVMKGYVDYLEKYVPGERVSKEKLLHVLGLMRGQVGRLERYTRDMSAAQRLEDLSPRMEDIPLERLLAAFAETGTAVCGEKFHMEMGADGAPEHGTLRADMELVLQIYENLVSNAARYARTFVKVRWQIDGNRFAVTVQDDGPGFTASALREAAQPFFRDGQEADGGHFGMGLYICRILCEKCGGGLMVRNRGGGGEVTAWIRCGEDGEAGCPETKKSVCR